MDFLTESLADTPKDDISFFIILNSRDNSDLSAWILSSFLLKSIPEFFTLRYSSSSTEYLSYSALTSSIDLIRL